MKQSNAMHTTRKPPRKPLLPPRKPVYVYRWDRILTGIATLLVLAGVAYGVVSWFASSPQEGSDRAEIPPKANVGMEGQQPGSHVDPIQLANKETPRSFAEQETIPAQVAEKTEPSSDITSEKISLSEDPVSVLDSPLQQTEGNPLETHSPSAETAQSTDISIADGGAEEMIAHAIDVDDSEPVPVAPSSKESLNLLLEAELSDPQTRISENSPFDGPGESPDSADKTLGNDRPDRAFQLKELRVLDPSVKRFLLTKSVAKREPLGELKDIRFNAHGSAVVWAYSEVVDMRGSRLNYIWLREGNRIATVPVNIRGNRWRSYSSKVINQSMSGAWRVELRDDNGRLMASADFFLE